MSDILDNRPDISGSAYLSDTRTGDGLLKVHGVALGENDITVGSESGEPKLWRREVLQESAELLEGKDIVADHENKSAYFTIGEVTDAGYKEGVGIIYEGVIQDDELEPKIEHEWLDVSPRVLHTPGEEVSDNVTAPGKIRDYDNLSVVRRGASESNTLKPGENEELSAEELQAYFDECEEGECEYQYNPSAKVLEELQEGFDFSQWMYEEPEGAQGATEKFPCSGIHEHEVDGETWYMPCSSHDGFLQSVQEAEDEEMQMGEARMPDYDGTEEASWGDIPADTLSYYTNNLDYDAEEWGDLNEEQRREIASHTLLGDPDADGVGGGIFFPVVNAANGNLNRGALEAVRSGRGQSANITESTHSSAFRMAGSLLNEEFDADVEEEMAEHMKENSREMSQLASQLASHTELTKSDSRRLVKTLSPGFGTVDTDVLGRMLASAFGSDEEKMKMLMEKMADKRLVEMSDGALKLSSKSAESNKEDETEAKDSPLNKLRF